MASRVDNDQTLRNFVGYYPAGPAVEAVKSALTELEQLRTSVAGLRDYVDSGVSDNELVIQLQVDLRCLRKAARELVETWEREADETDGGHRGEAKLAKVLGGEGGQE